MPHSFHYQQDLDIHLQNVSMIYSQKENRMSTSEVTTINIGLISLGPVSMLMKYQLWSCSKDHSKKNATRVQNRPQCARLPKTFFKRDINLDLRGSA